MLVLFMSQMSIRNVITSGKNLSMETLGQSLGFSMEFM
jgi:hypothetical protein